MTTKYRHIHQDIIRLDGWDKVSGKAEYGADIHREGMLYLKAVYTEVVRGVLKEVRTDQKDAFVFTAKDIPGEKEFGIIVPDQPAISGDQIYSYADVIAVAAGETEEEAQALANSVSAVYEELLPVTDTEKAKKSECELRGAFYPGNVTSEYVMKKGDSEKGLSDAEVIVEGTYHTQRIEHTYIEPEAVFTEMEGDTLVIRGSMQLPYDVGTAVAKAFLLPPEKVSVRRSIVGGSFGGKIETTIAMGIRASLVTLKTGRPVMYRLTREESFRESHKRHPFDIRVRMGSTRDGELLAVEGDAVLDGGAYMNLSPAVAWKGNVLGCGPYRIGHTYYRSTSYMTNNVTAGSMRGFGTPQSIFAIESAMNELAFQLQMSPYQLRKKNIIRKGDTAPSDFVMDDTYVSAEKVLDMVAEHSGFEEKWRAYQNQEKGRYQYGIGIAVTMRGTSGAQIADRSRAVLYFDEEEKLHVSLGLVEMGQGLGTVIVQIAAEAMGLPLDRVIYDEPDTRIDPETGSTTGSRGTFMGGKAILDAAEKLKKAQEQGKELRCLGECVMEKPDWNFETGSGRPFHVYTYSAQTAEVRVDTWTGEVQVLKVTAAMDAGRVVHPTLAKGQVQGGIVMSLGQALLEEYRMGEDGKPVTRDLTGYMIPAITDMPKMEILFLEQEEAIGPFGAKSIAEPSVELGAAAIAGAVNQAIGMGRPIRSLPFTAEKILLHLRDS